jgi:hypothetical protein
MKKFQSKKKPRQVMYSLLRYYKNFAFCSKCGKPLADGEKNFR